MSEKTKNLGLFKYDTTTDGKQVFSIDKGMNENWDTIDSSTLTHRHITNCITEIPQRIKLELNDGILILKAGSEVIIPNGFEEDGVTPKFDYVTVESDISQTLSGSTSDTHFVSFLGSSGSPIGWRILPSRCYSGSTVPTQSGDMLWYDTSTNLIKYYQDNIFQNDGFSFPIALCTRTSGVYTSINQVFNGMGYIGSTVWVDKDVKGLIPNGKNEDGSLNNIEWVNDSLKMRNFENHGNNNYRLIFDVMGTDISQHLRTFDVTIYLDSYTNTWSYPENVAVYSGLYLSLGVFEIDDNKITFFNPKPPFRALDYNDKPEISGWGRPSDKYIDLTLGKTDTTYTAPATGWFQLSKAGADGKNQYINVSYPHSENDYVYSHNTVKEVNTHIGACLVPITKGKQIKIRYTMTGTTYTFRFIYAEGEV